MNVYIFFKMVNTIDSPKIFDSDIETVIGLKCSSDAILAKNCLDHVICPYKEIYQISRYG